MPSEKRRVRMWHRLLAGLGTVGLLAALAVPTASAIDFTIDPDLQEAKAVADSNDPANTNPSDPSNCPTLTSPPRALEAWFNTDDMEYRGYLDPKNQRSWSFANKIAQIICGAKQNSKIHIGMFFIRAIGTADRPESDTEIIWRAMDYVNKYRNVKIYWVMDGGSITSDAAKDNIKKRLATFNSDIKWCYNGCLNINKSSKYPDALNHEKFLTISDTIWENDGEVHPAVYSSSGNFARSQVRTYWQEATLVYDDHKLYDYLYDRYVAMKVCSGSVSSDCKAGRFPTTATEKHSLKLERKIWIDNVYRHYTDADRGTTVSFSPQPVDVLDYYVSQFRDVDCAVDNKIRVAMYRLTDTRAQRFIDTIKKLKSQGCDVRVLLSQQGGASTISPKVAKMLKKANLTAQVNCTRVPIHTKLILIGPSNNNSGRIMFGTANMSTSGLRYSEEHVITMDSRRASAEFASDIRQVYGVYQAGWNELNQGSRTCK